MNSLSGVKVDCDQDKLIQSFTVESFGRSLYKYKLSCCQAHVPILEKKNWKTDWRNGVYTYKDSTKFSELENSVHGQFDVVTTLTKTALECQSKSAKKGRYRRKSSRLTVNGISILSWGVSYVRCLGGMVQNYPKS